MKPASQPLFFVFLLFFSAAASARTLPIPKPPALPAASYALLDLASGQMLAAKNPNQRIAPASITKLMTCYIVFDEIKHGNLTPKDEVTVSKKAWKMHGSQMFLKVGDKVTVDELIQGLITASGNDAAVALAQYIAGTTSTFAEYMNQYAKALGLSNSHFMNPDGLPHKSHYMSARDIAILLGAIIKQFPDLYQRYFHQKKFTYNGIRQYNRNSLLWSDPRVDGGKTGHTEAAGYNYAGSAKSHGMRTVAVVTGAGSENARKDQCEALLNYGFRFFKNGKLFSAGQEIAQIKVWKGAQSTLAVVAQGPVYVAYPRGQRDSLTTSANLPTALTAPVKKGKRLGRLSVKYNGQTLTQVPLYAGAKIEQGSLIQRWTDDVLMLFQ